MFNIQRCYVRRFITLFLNTPDTVDRLFTHIDVIFVANVSIILEF